MDLVKFPFFTTIIIPLLVIQQQARAVPVCKDLDSKCSVQYATYCSYDNVKQQCPLTCNQCGSIHPSSPVTSKTSSQLIDATQSTVVVSQSLTPAQSTMPISQVTSVSQSLTPTQSTVSVSQVLTQTRSSVDQSQGLVKSPPTQSTDVTRSSSTVRNKIKTQKFARASASKTKLTQANLLITFGILRSYIMYWP